MHVATAELALELSPFLGCLPPQSNPVIVDHTTMTTLQTGSANS